MYVYNKSEIIFFAGDLFSFFSFYMYVITKISGFYHRAAGSLYYVVHISTSYPSLKNSS